MYMMDESQPKTLYVGNLDGSVSEELLIALFSQMGPVKNCKIIREPGNDPYAFIEYSTYQAATTALTAMNKRLFLDKEIKVNWATSPGNQPKTDISSHHHIFVGDLSPEIETETLREAFAPFGEISNCRIVRDPQTMKSKGYAFVSFVKKAEAENAIQAMNGQWIGSRSIRTNWSTRKLPPPRESTKSGSGMGMKGNIRHTFEEVYNQSSPTNTTVYCGGFPPNVISDEVMHKHFIQFGPIQDVRVFKDKGYAFIKFVTKESAARAIEHTHNSEVHGNQVKCFWGKENGGDNSMNNVVAASAGVAAAAAAAAAAAGTIMSPGLPTTPQQAAAAAVVANAAAAGAGLPAQMMTQQQLAAQYPYAAAYQQMGYWYPPTLFTPLQGYPAAQMQTQYMQQGYYPYAYASAQQAGAAGYRMVQPNVTWGVPGAVVPGVTAAAATAAAAANGSLGPQMMYSAAMPQYQGQ
ncbi:nucleolysin TIAR isoform X1 [Ceratitis capitata]|uniref:Nucleolysin TIAR n=1 Tax=Ceratitis capitata TaxID=7213 RepID=W8AS17_CERCA|nr:nucleolysin TIAR isoform X1 [Ceratitis capitata]XP_004533645.1 nucleolysin TIAR isoform X1 [Ceratitis capitata]XP_004533646.1 nucleolysin TIAR isoform X1 [Ceratitis capitata]XP_020716348.1 nucleolysin TIAR isoform X1 [Ceratitis capitata]